MVPIRLAILGHKDFFLPLVRDLVPTIEGVQITAHPGFGEECIPIAQKLESTGIDAIVTGQAIRELIKGEVDIPVISLRITYEDLLAAILKGIPHGRKMALVLGSFEGLDVRNLKIIEDLAQVTLERVNYGSTDELEERIVKLQRTGTSVVIGTALPSLLARKHGLDAIVIYSLDSTLQEAVYHALEIVRVKRREEERTEQFRTILDFAHEGIIAADHQGLINLCNASVLQILRLRREEVMGAPLTQVFPRSKVVNSRRPEMGVVETVGDVTVVANHTPVKIRTRTTGFVTTFHDITRIQELENAIRLMTQAKGMQAKVHFADIIGQSDAIEKAIVTAKKYAESDFTLLIEGETGSGKEMFAQSIHNHSKRRASPFVAVNCSALPENLLESELFGYEDGAFTGARKSGKKGLFELAHNGSIFLDEISSVSPSFQSRLLRVLQEREIMRIGSNKVIPVNVRIIAAANENLSLVVSEGRFRPDLYFRLNVLTLKIPPLRQRKEDIPGLVQQMIQETAPEILEGLRPHLTSLIRPLLEYNFPGNIRELRSVVQRFLILVDRTRLEDLEYLIRLMRECIGETPVLSPSTNRLTVEIRDSLRATLEDVERRTISRTLQEANGEKARAAQALGVSRTTLYRRLAALGMQG